MGKNKKDGSVVLLLNKNSSLFVFELVTFLFAWALLQNIKITIRFPLEGRSNRGNRGNRSGV